MRRKITVFIIIGVCYLLQTTFFDTLSFASISPNLLIIVTSSFGFMRGRKEGLFIGFFCGLLLDIFGPPRQAATAGTIPERVRSNGRENQKKEEKTDAAPYGALRCDRRTGGNHRWHYTAGKRLLRRHGRTCRHMGVRRNDHLFL